MILVKFSCGCVGIEPRNDAEAEKTDMVYVCDAAMDDPFTDGYGLTVRDMRRKSFEPLYEEDARVLVRRLAFMANSRAKVLALGSAIKAVLP